jgi:hypothetical protein
LNDFATSIIRTYVPIAVGGVVGWLATRGVKISPEQAAQLGIGPMAFSSFSYYLVVRLVEQKYPGAGALLGSAKKPEYTAEAEK